MLRALYRFIYFRLLGWKLEDHRPPDMPNYIIVVAPHTSNWDFPLGVLVRRIARLGDTRYLAKASLFRPPLGWFFRALGGYPVDRSKSQNMVDQVVTYFREVPGFKLAITPEGTRKRQDNWKTGFYYIAKAANVPIILCALDYGRKTVSFSAPFVMSDDKDADIERMKDHYRNVKGCNPELGVF
mgnify:CR=1 FL=1